MMNLARHAAVLALVTMLGLAPVLVVSIAQPRSSSENPTRPEIIFVQAPVIQTGNLLARFPQGSRIVHLAGGGTSPVNLTPEFFAAADPQVSPDGTRVLFAAKKDATAPWQIWEMNTDGSAKSQLTRCDGDCLRPAYLAREEIVFTALVREARGSASQLYVAKRDGSEAHPITFGPGDFELETVLSNGLILASARSPLLPGGRRARDLYTLRPDGSGLSSFRCEHGQPAVRTQAAELVDGAVVYVKNPLADRGVGGELVAIRRGALHNSVVSPLRTLSWSPRYLEGTKLLVARQAIAGDVAKGRFDLYAFDFASGKLSGPLYRGSRLSSVQAVPVAAHPAPRWYWSTLNPALKVGYFVCLDAYFSAEAPKGRLAASLSRVRVLAFDPASGAEGTLGEAPVEKDGSFYIAVPPDRPVRFELLDKAGRVVRAQRSWIWARSGEEHGCVGCHENKALAPENRWPLTLRRFDTPTRLGVEAGPQPAH